MATQKGNCASFWRWNGTGWDKISQVYNIGGLGIEFNEIENDSFIDCDATTGASSIREKDTGAGTMKNPTLELGFDPEKASTNETNQALLASDAGTQDETFYRISLPNEEASGFIFVGKVKMLDIPSIEADSFIRISYEFLQTRSLSPIGFLWEDDVNTIDVTTL